jgi:two-component system chemotaxis response regulator CheY
LVQDVGILVMARAFGERYVESLHRVRRIPHLQLAPVEKDCFGVTHAEISAALLRKWELPQSFVSLVLRHHDRDGPEQAATDLRFLRVMQIGEAFSDLHDNHAPQRHLYLRSLLKSYGAEAAAECRDCLAQAVERATESSEVFSVAAPEEESLRSTLKELARQEEFREAPAAEEENGSERMAPGATRQTDTNVVDQKSCQVPAQKPAASSPTALSLDQPLVLVIDRDPLLVKTIRLYLQGWDCRVIACDKLEAARPLTPLASVVLCDVHVNGQSGAHVVRALRAEGYSGPIIVVSGDDCRATVLECIQAGVNDYLLKPFSQAQVKEKLRRWLATIQTESRQR